MPHAADTGEADLSLDDTQSLSGQDSHIEVETSQASEVMVYVDNGSNSDAKTYDIQAERRVEKSIDDWMQHTKTAGSTARRHTFDAPGNTVRIDVTNTSGTNGNQYRVYAESLVED